jgi:putative transposase
VGLSRSAFYRVPDDWTVRDAQVIGALATLVEGRPSRGFWKCRKILRRQGRPWNHKRIYRVYKRMNLHLRRPAKKRLPKRLRVPLYVPRLPDTVWSADFMSDTLLCGRRFRTFNVVDDFNREAMHIEVDTSITSERLIRIFERLQAERGLPQVLRTDNGPEFLGEAFTNWAKHAAWRSSTSSPASRTRTLTSSGSIGPSAMSCWTNICSPRSTTSERPSTGG